MSSRRIVAVGNDPDVHLLAQQYGQEVFVSDDPLDALDVVQRVCPNLVLLDHRFGRTQIEEFLRRADNNLAAIPVVIVGSDGCDIGSSVEFTQMGARDYLRGRHDYGRLERIIETIEGKHGADERNTEQANEISPANWKGSANRFFAEDLAGSVFMAGKSPAVVNALKMIRLVAASRCNPILIVGETGTGKELAAKAVHMLRHPNDRFVAVNCAALTAALLESELFGHVKGAFTGADRDKTGLLELAGSGTLLLDEISEMPMDLQAKLLRVLQERTFRKVGGVKDITCGATIIASSNRNLKAEVQANRFRRDLYYRLDVGPIVLAPLRSPERRADVGLLAEYFLEVSTICPEKRNTVMSLTRLAVEALEKHDWPGNVRELRNVIDRAILLETTDKIGLSRIVIDATLCAQASENPTAGLIKNFSLAKAEQELIFRALHETGWQKTRAAALLGITRATLYAKVKQYNISKDSRASRSRTDNTLETASTPPVPELASAC
jgi:DNA-binding NtrC family response regulator